MAYDNDLGERIILGAAAGLASTIALQGIRTSTKQLLPQTTPPMREDPGEFMVGQAEELLPYETREQVPQVVETTAAKSLALGYGMTAGAIYAALRPDGGDPLLDGVGLGLGTWAVGYLGWLPALGLMPPIHRQEAPQVVVPIMQHVLFGIATALVYRRLYQNA